ncbi:hypothetical protein ACHAW5_001802 [Stephanodiscus triporus]|uniref:Uncharacterized protein n=1 Tax=Stephanodiscus triporus TaxID=2934178 RepID=A0ABD3N0H6_9STRA
MQGGRDNGYPQHRRQPMEPEDDYDGDYPDDEPYGHAMNREENGDQLNDASGAEDAVLDLAELEQLQEEAERMKGLGNKHMAAQVIALAPTFGKAHARLGQALYFLKQYKGAVEAYEDALKFEQEDGNGGNSAAIVTRAYLQKAKEKLAKQEEKEKRKQERVNGTAWVDDNTMAGEESLNPSTVYSIATDKERVGLANDPILTPQLHVGRAHALNGQERFESAKIDALMALKHILRYREEDVSAAEAYSVLGKSLYYSKDYQGSIEALEESDRILKINGGKLSVFDEAYLEQCREALDAGLGVEHDDGLSLGGGKSVMSSGVKSVVTCIKEGKSIFNIPKLKPPRFVPREKCERLPE